MKNRIEMITTLALMTGFVLLSAGCATAPLETDASTSGIRAAEEVGAANVPQASLHLQLAKEGLSKARTLNTNGEQEKAESMLLRAEADAEMAVLLSREEAEITEARLAVARVQELRDSTKTSGTPPVRTENKE